MPGPYPLPTVGGDDDTWGQMLNDFLSVSHDPSDGTLKSTAISAAGGALATNNLSDLSSASTARSNLNIDDIATVQSNLSATSAPGTSDDSGSGYAVGSRWVNTSTNISYTCTDASSGAAVWVPDLPVGTGANTVAAGNDSRIANAEVTTNKDTDTTLAADSDTKYPSQKAIKTYVDTRTTTNIDGGVPEHSINLSGWYTKYKDVVKGTGRAKVLVIGDSISSFYGVDSWPGLLHGMFQAHRTTEGLEGEVLGSRFPNTGALSTNELTTTTAGTYTQNGAGAQSAILASGDEITQTFTGDAISVVYGTSSTGGTLNVYDGPSSGTVVSSVNTSGSTTYSNILDVTFASVATRTVTIKASGGTGTLLEQVVPHAGTLTQGVDLRTAARFGYNTRSYLPTGAPNAGTNSQSHALDYINSFQPDLVINALGQNDASESNWATDTQLLYDQIMTFVPTTNILTVLMYSTTTFPARGGWIDDANTIAATYPGQIDTVSLPVSFGNLDKLINRYGSGLTTDAGIHPTTITNYMMMLPIAGKLLGDPFAVIANLPAMLTMGSLAYTVGSITASGAISGNLSGSVTGPLLKSTITLTASRSFATSDIGNILVYNGTSDITIDVSGSVGISLYNGTTEIKQLNSGKVFVTASGGLSYSGPASTSAKGEVLSLQVPTTTVTVVYGTLYGNEKSKRVGSTTSSATPTINTDNYDIYKLTAQTADITSFSTNLSGTPTAGQRLEVQITGTAARAITWGSSFASTTVALPTTTVSTNKLRVLFEWDSDSSVWACIGVA